MPSHLVTSHVRRCFQCHRRLRFWEESAWQLYSHTPICLHANALRRRMEVYYCNTQPKRNSFQVFPQGTSSPFKLYPSTCSPSSSPEKTCGFSAPQLVPCPQRAPAPRALPSHLPATPRPLSRAPRGVGTPAPPGQRPGTSCAGTRGRAPFLREGEPQPRCSRGSARPEQSTASPWPGTTDTHTRNTHNTRLAPVRYCRRGANSHPEGSGLRSPRQDRHRDPAARAQPSDNRSPQMRISKKKTARRAVHSHYLS